MNGRHAAAWPAVPLVLACIVFPASAAEGTASIAGHATGNHVPLAYEWVDLVSTDGVTYSDSTWLDADGAYVFNGVPAATYRVCVDSHNFDLVPQCFDHVDRSSPSPGEPAFTPLVVADGAQLTGIDFDLVEGNAIAGRVTDARNGQPIVDLYVRFGYLDAQGEFYGEGHAHTDADGRYRAIGLPDGAYYLAFSAYGPFSDAAQVYGGTCDTQCDPTQGTLITLANGTTHTGVDFQLHPAAIIRGHVRDATTQQGIGDVVVSSFYSQWSPFGTVWSKAWSTPSNPDGTYELYAYSVGRVVADGGGAFVDIVYPNIPCSSYSVTNCVYLGQDISVPVPQPLENVDFSLPTGVGITGTVVSAPTSTPIANAIVTIVDSAGSLSLQTSSGADGSFTLPASMPLASDVYYASVAEYDWPFTCAVYLDRPCPTVGQPIGSVAPTPIHLVTGMNHLQLPVIDDGIFHGTFDP